MKNNQKESDFTSKIRHGSTSCRLDRVLFCRRLDSGSFGVIVIFLFDAVATMTRPVLAKVDSSLTCDYMWEWARNTMNQATGSKKSLLRRAPEVSAEAAIFLDKASFLLAFIAWSRKHSVKNDEMQAISCQQNNSHYTSCCEHVHLYLVESRRQESPAYQLQRRRKVISTIHVLRDYRTAILGGRNAEWQWKLRPVSENIGIQVKNVKTSFAS